MVDAQLEELAYGDPASHPTNVNVEGALRWYASKHIPTLKDEDQLDFSALPCPSQDIFDDWWSCGIFSYNALAHCFACHPLLTQTENPIFTDLAQMVILQKLIACHNETVCDACFASQKYTNVDVFNFRPFLLRHSFYFYFEHLNST